MSPVYHCSALNRTKITFQDLQGVLNDQFHVVSDLLSGICLSLRTISYGKAMLWNYIVICLVRSGWLMISYSKDMSVILYLASGFSDDPGYMMTQS